MRYAYRWLGRFFKERKLIFLLKKLGAWNIPHARSSFFEHLWGTYVLLRRWKCSDDVCYAGMLHSIYGTSSFKFSTVPYEKRCLIREYIGQDAERLVYLFSKSKRPDSLLHKPPKLKDDEFYKLVHIECANLLDQRYNAFYLEKLVKLHGNYLSKAALSSIGKYLNDINL